MHIQKTSQSSYHELRILANVATLKDAELTAAAFSAPDSHSEYFKSILEKLGRIAIASNKNIQFLKSAEDILTPFQNHQILFPQCSPSQILKLKEDTDARVMLTMCENMFRKWRPIYTLPDGNCAFNAFVLYLTASISLNLSRLLRICVVVELLFHHNDYHGVLANYCKSSNADFINDEIYQEMRSVCKDKHYCGFVTFVALATVLSHPVRLIHPIVSVQTKSGFAYNSHSMNCTFFTCPRHKEF